MNRGRLISPAECCVHVPQRRHAGRMLLGADIDPKQYAKRLWQAAQGFRPVPVLELPLRLGPGQSHWATGEAQIGCDDG